MVRLVLWPCLQLGGDAQHDPRRLEGQFRDSSLFHGHRKKFQLSISPMAPWMNRNNTLRQSNMAMRKSPMKNWNRFAKFWIWLDFLCVSPWIQRSDSKEHEGFDKACGQDPMMDILHGCTTRFGTKQAWCNNSSAKKPQHLSGCELWA